jgi:hypothetical protein
MDKRQKSVLRYSDSIPETAFNEPQDIPHKGYIDKGDVWEEIGGIKRNGPAVTELVIPLFNVISIDNYRAVRMYVSITNNESISSDYRMRFNGDDGLNYIPVDVDFFRLLENASNLGAGFTRTGFVELYCDKLVGERYNILPDNSNVRRMVVGYTGATTISSILLYSTLIDAITDVNIKITGLKA